MNTAPRTPVRLLALGLPLLICFGVGCASKTTQLEKVAKDWCETIRASQVIPVYPLTEDLRPGDVFLVQTSISEEASRYKQRGFLALDDYRTRLRLPDAAYSREYFDGYWKDTYWSNPPNARPARTAGALPGPGAAGAAGAAPASLLSDANAPRAAFPTYTFDVSNSGGLSLAVPIQGIPLAMGVLGADRATGSVTIADARTHAASPEVVYECVREWAARDDIRAQLRWAARTSEAPVYVRVVTRVYYAGAMNVSITRDGAFGADFAGGKAPNLDLISEDGSVNENNIEILSKMNGEASGARPAESAAEGAAGAATRAFDWANVGVRFKYQSLSSRSVSISEMFDTLLVIGYLGFDAPVYLNGEIGPPLPTFLRLEGVLDSPSALRSAENRYLQQTLLVRGLGRCTPTDPAEQARWAMVIVRVNEQLPGAGFEGAGEQAARVLADIKQNPAGPSSPEREADLRAAAEAFVSAADSYVGSDADAEYPMRSNRLTDAFDIAFEATRVPAAR